VDPADKIKSTSFPLCLFKKEGRKEGGRERGREGGRDKGKGQNNKGKYHATESELEVSFEDIGTALEGH
jgi:hypothetical protein